MTPERWARVTALFDQASGRPLHERDAWLAAQDDDQAVHAEVAAMLRAFDADPEFLEQPTGVAEAVALAASTGLEGRRVGAWRIVKEIGRGGMGLVYEAHRDDQEFDRRAAIKILPALSAPALADRFRFERHVLAGLDHPGIARLFDAGTTGDGVPYFVMEFVDGQPIDAWCRARASRAARSHHADRAGVRRAGLRAPEPRHPPRREAGQHPGGRRRPAEAARLRHRRHARRQGRSRRRATRTGHHSFTPEYASPEQVRGERVTTASDVYSAGVLMYLLLAGRPPYALKGLSPLDAMRTICEVDPPLMSAVAEPAARGALRGDLDAIVAKSLAKAPADRYGTVGELTADLRAWREGRPVSAAPQSAAYLARRFMRRHRGPVAAAAALTLAILGGAAATAWQARVAQQERDKAQNRFRQVQEFSRSLLFDVHNALRAVPGATEARRLLLDRAVQFLDGLAADAGADDALAVELAEGYRRLGQVQGAPGTENLGQTAAAAVSFRKAAALIDQALSARPDALERLMLAADIHGDLVFAEREGGTGPASDRAEARHLSLLGEIERRSAGNPAARARLAADYSNAGIHRADRRDFDGALRHYSHAVEIYASLPEEIRAGTERARDYSLTLKRLGAVEMMKGALDDSERHYRDALAIEDELIRRDPASPRWPFEQSYTLSDLGLIQRRRGRIDEAIAFWTRALAIRRQALAADARNNRAMSGVAALLNRLAWAYQDAARYPEAVAHFREELGLQESMIAIQGRAARAYEHGWALANLATALLKLADTGGAQAGAQAQEARTLFRQIRPAEVIASGTTGPDAEFQTAYAALSARLAAR